LNEQLDDEKMKLPLKMLPTELFKNLVNAAAIRPVRPSEAADTLGRDGIGEIIIIPTIGQDARRPRVGWIVNLSRTEIWLHGHRPFALGEEFMIAWKKGSALYCQSVRSAARLGGTFEIHARFTAEFRQDDAVTSGPMNVAAISPALRSAPAPVAPDRSHVKCSTAGIDAGTGAAAASAARSPTAPVAPFRSIVSFSNAEDGGFQDAHIDASDDSSASLSPAERSEVDSLEDRLASLFQ
jgi:hypothetical protein